MACRTILMAFRRDNGIRPPVAHMIRHLCHSMSTIAAGQRHTADAFTFLLNRQGGT